MYKTLERRDRFLSECKLSQFENKARDLCLSIFVVACTKSACALVHKCMLPQHHNCWGKLRCRTLKKIHRTQPGKFGLKKCIFMNPRLSCLILFPNSADAELAFFCKLNLIFWIWASTVYNWSFFIKICESWKMTEKKSYMQSFLNIHGFIILTECVWVWFSLEMEK